MTETLQRPVVTGRERLNLAADAFLYAAMVFLAVVGVQEGLALLVSGGDTAGWTPPVWLEVVGALGMPLALIGGPLLAWRVHGRHLQWRDLVAAVVGALLGSAVFGVVMLVLVPLTRLVQGPAMDEQGPWLAGAVAALAVVAFLPPWAPWAPWTGGATTTRPRPPSRTQVARAAQSRPTPLRQPRGCRSPRRDRSPHQRTGLRTRRRTRHQRRAVRRVNPARRSARTP